MTEDDFLESIIDLAHVYGWKVFHARAARTGKGWRTPVQGDGAGFPDLVLVRERVIFAELKTDKGKLSELQEDWTLALNTAVQEVYVWHPSDWDRIVEVLKRKWVTYLKA
jgi:hypothetical protein